MSADSRKKNISTIIILVIVLLVPGFLYVLVNRMGTNSYVKLPIYGEKVATGKMKRVMGREIPDTSYHIVPELILKDSKSDIHLFTEDDSTVNVVHLFYPGDQGLSVAMLQNLRPIAERFKNNNLVRFYSICVDPQVSTDELSNFARPYLGGLEQKWQALGNPDIDLLTYSRDHLLVDAMRDGADSTRYVIGSQYVLIDTDRRIRGFYDINLKSEVDRLTDEIKVQMVEEIRNNPYKVEKK